MPALKLSILIAYPLLSGPANTASLFLENTDFRIKRHLTCDTSTCCSSCKWNLNPISTWFPKKTKLRPACALSSGCGEGFLVKFVVKFDRVVPNCLSFMKTGNWWEEESPVNIPTVEKVAAWVHPLLSIGESAGEGPEKVPSSLHPTARGSQECYLPFCH